LAHLFGASTNGALGNIVDAIAVIATILGVSVTIGFGVSQFVEGIYAVTAMEWLMMGTADAPKPSTVGLVAALIVIMGMSILSAVSGVGRGIKYLSNLNLVLSLILLGTFNLLWFVRFCHEHLYSRFSRLCDSLCFHVVYSLRPPVAG